jgi:hypothetical protein
VTDIETLSLVLNSFGTFSSRLQLSRSRQPVHIEPVEPFVLLLMDQNRHDIRTGNLVSPEYRDSIVMFDSPGIPRAYVLRSSSIAAKSK